MIGKHFFVALAVAIVVASASLTAVAQVGELRGKVWMQQADGQKVPLADAQIDVFRTDIKGEYKTKTNKKGEWVFAGIPFVGTYVVAVSHPTASPTFIPGVRAGRGIPVELEVKPGDGKRLTLEEIKNAGPATGAAMKAWTASGISPVNTNRDRSYSPPAGRASRFFTTIEASEAEDRIEAYTLPVSFPTVLIGPGRSSP